MGRTSAGGHKPWSTNGEVLDGGIDKIFARCTENIIS